MPEANLEVRLVAYSPEPERLVANMAKLCYANDERVKELLSENTNPAEDARMIKMLIEMGHLSPLEHASWNFVARGVSRVLTHQLVRHRVASYSQRSQRYVGHQNFPFIIPPSIKEDAGMRKKYEEFMRSANELYIELCNFLKCKGLGREEINHDARYVLPNACETIIGFTMNARELLHVFRERLCNRSQWEIREFFYKVLELVYPTAPNIFEYAGPLCYSEGRCRQGKKSCNRAEEAKIKLEKIKLDSLKKKNQSDEKGLVHSV